MIRKNYHCHTTFCDGKSTAEEMVQAAIDCGFTELGFSGHSYTFFDESYCMTKENTKKYIEEINRLKEAYKDKIGILCGIEQDYYSEESPAGYDFIIGSVHYLKFGDEYVPVDEGNTKHRYAIEKYLGGDVVAFAEKYFETVANVVEKTGCDIIGHFDLLSKYREKDPLYNENSPRYIAAWKKALDELLKTDAVFEINTGAISRGVRTTPYPDPAMIDYIKTHGGKLILSSDSHSANSIDCGFERFENLL